MEVGTRWETRDGRYYFYQNNGAPVLAVAHLDYVHDSHHFFVNRFKSGAMVWNGQLDDRLGVHVILDVLPRFLGQGAYDILLTTGEESGQTTAYNFVPPKHKYNWIFSFDRKGDDVVTYQYNGHKWESALREAGMRIGYGSFSCIRALSNLGVHGVNVGVGYEDYHGEFSHAWWPDTERQVQKFVRFFMANFDTEFPWNPPPVQTHKPYVPIPNSQNGNGNGYQKPPLVALNPPKSDGSDTTGSGTKPSETTLREVQDAANGIKPEIESKVVPTREVVEVEGVRYLVTRYENRATYVVLEVDDDIVRQRLCPACYQMGDSDIIGVTGMCENCAQGNFGTLICTGCQKSVISEQYSFRTGLCFPCLLDEERTPYGRQYLI